jgi:hypothetical protein
VPSINRTREAVQTRLGGYFDYSLIVEELRLLSDEKEQIERDFRSQALIMPEFKDKVFKKLPDYDFSTPSIFSKDPKDADFFKERVSYERPANMVQIATEPKYFLDYEAFQQEKASQ